MRVLVAAQPAAWAVLRMLLQECSDAVPVHSPADAFTLLRRPHQTDAILATIAFDDSRMLEFLQAVKRDRVLRKIPFLCLRVLPSVLPDNLVQKVGDVCKKCGAVDLIDLANLPPGAAASILRSALASSAPAPGI